MKIISTNIGEKREIDWNGKTITTGIFKYPIKEPIFLGTENVLNDEISDRKHHGGIDQAVYGYSLKHYDYFKKLHPHLDWQLGMFGENLTVDDLDETKTHVGDTFKVGETILEVTTIRTPCYKLGIRFKDNKIIKQFWNTNMCGVYFKVLQTGFVKAGDVFEQLKSCPENQTIAEVYETKRVRKGM